jgi:hypothetical protein
MLRFFAFLIVDIVLIVAIGRGFFFFFVNNVGRVGVVWGKGERV